MVSTRLNHRRDKLHTEQTIQRVWKVQCQRVCGLPRATRCNGLGRIGVQVGKSFVKPLRVTRHNAR